MARTRWRTLRRIAAAIGAIAVACSAAAAGPDAPYITLASTTSTDASGLFDAILPVFAKETGIEVRVVAVGTGQALRMGRRGDADVVLVHDRASEDEFVAKGYGRQRLDVMYNDFVIVGPKADPAGVLGGKQAVGALATIASAGAAFISRGDDSGTHKAELRIWKAAGVDPSLASGTWYREVGAGMGSTLNTAAAMGAYTLSDRGTWLSFRNRRDLVVAVEGDPPLFNPYGVIRVNEELHPHVKGREGQIFVDWLVSEAGQAEIARFRIDGQELFHPNAGGGSTGR